MIPQKNLLNKYYGFSVEKSQKNNKLYSPIFDSMSVTINYATGRQRKMQTCNNAKL